MPEENDMVVSKAGKYFILFLFLLLPGFLYPQHLSRLKTANQLYESQQYWNALKKYQKVYSKIRNNREEKNLVAYRMAKCYRMTENYTRAEFLYKHLIRYGYDKKHPEVILDLADLLKMDGKFDEALKYYQIYENQVPNDPRGKLGETTTKLVKIWIENPSKYKVKDIRKINSRESDFAPAFLSANNNRLVFTSNRKESTGKDIDNWTGMKFTDLFEAQLDRNGEWTTPVLLDKSGNINTKANEGAATLNDQYNAVYFTRCKKIEDKKAGCQIYKSVRIGRNWRKAQLVKIHGVDSTMTVGQPTLSHDELTLIFSSDKRGTLGGTDLWISTRKGKASPFGHPFNLGPVINTKGNEVFPFLRNDSTLYFSSDGHGGMGGLDIFVSKKDSLGNWGKPVNLRYPVNSTYDDFGIVFEAGTNKGYFSSNRKGSRGKEDIYSFVQPTVDFTLSGTVQDDQTLFGIPNINVLLSSAKNLTLSTLTNVKGFYSFEKSQVRKNTAYTVTVGVKNYFTTASKFSTVGKQFSKDFKINFSLKRIPSSPIMLPDILYDLGKWDLKPQFQDSLQGLVQLLRNNPGLVIELGSHTDSRGTTESNDILSQKRALSVVNYLIMRGINPGRLVAKGYGERVPRTLQKNIKKDRFFFMKGTKLTDGYINDLKSTTEKEAAFALNRRTEFRVLRRDFSPQESASIADTSMTIPMNQPQNAVQFTKDKTNGMYVAGCVINGYAEQFIFDKNNSAQISLKKAIKMLQEGVITKDDFEGNPEIVLKNNTIANHAVVNLKNITIAGKTVKNIQFIVSDNLYFGIVMSQQVLRKFGKYQFDTKTNLLIIHEK